MKICLDLRYRTESGASSYIRNVVPKILETGAMHTYFLIKYVDQQLDFEHCTDHIICSPKPWPLMLLWDFILLPIMLFRLKTDIYHPLKSPGPFWVGSRKIYTMHSITHDYEGSFPTSPRRFIYDILYTNSFIRHSDKLIAVSNFIRDFLQDSFHLSPDRIRVVYHGIDPVFRPVSEAIIKGTRQRYHLPEQYLLSVANITPVKNFLTTVRAFARIASDTDADLVIIGGQAHSYFQELVEEVERLGLSSRIVFPGFVSGEDLVAIMNGAVALVMPSLTEGCPVTMLEAFACGLPVIASKRGGLWDLGKNCALFVVDPMDAHGFSQRMLNILQNKHLRLLLKKKSFTKASEHSWEKAAAEHLALYELLWEKRV